jgi:hypothetical protein
VDERHPTESRSAHCSRDSAAEELAPHAPGLAVEEHQVRAIQVARDAEGQGSVPDAPLVRDGARAERAPGDGNRQSADDVVDDLVQGEEIDRVRPRHAAVVDADDEARIGERACLLGPLVAWPVDRRDRIDIGRRVHGRIVELADEVRLATEGAPQIEADRRTARLAGAVGPLSRRGSQRPGGGDQGRRDRERRRRGERSVPVHLPGYDARQELCDSLRQSRSETGRNARCLSRRRSQVLDSIAIRPRAARGDAERIHQKRQARRLATSLRRLVCSGRL